MHRRCCLIVILLALLAVLPAPAGAPKKKLLLLAQGPDGHPPETHEYLRGQQVLQKALEKSANLDITLARADEPWREGPELLTKADGVVLFLSEGAKWLQNNPERLKAFQELARRKGGLVVLHWGMGSKDAKNIDAFVQLFGGCHGGPDRKYKVLSTRATIVDKQHPISRGLDDFPVRDEFYYHLKFVKAEPAVQPVLRVAIDGQDETVAWAWQRPDGGRSFGFSGLHFHENWQLSEYRRLVTQAVRWSLALEK
jgi:type 1 glutamine amidotransferase